MILVIGGTGVAGAEVVQELVRRDAGVRALVRDERRARERLGAEVDLRVGDLADRASVEAALQGVDRLVLSCADDPRRVGWETRVIDAAASGGVRRIVRLSAIGAQPGAPVPFWDWHGRVDEHLRASGIDHVVLRSAFYMSGVAMAAESVARDGRLYAAAGAARIAMIDPRDVGAAAAAAALGAGGPAGTRTCAITGPEALTYADVAVRLADRLGRPVEYVEVPDSAAREALRSSGAPDVVADAVVALFGQLRAGACSTVTNDFRALTGRSPGDFAGWAAANARLFARPPAMV